MVTPKIILYVENALKQGYSTYKVHETLYGAGYSFEQINEILQKVNERKQTRNIAKPRYIQLNNTDNSNNPSNYQTNENQEQTQQNYKQNNFQNQQFQNQQTNQNQYAKQRRIFNQSKREQVQQTNQNLNQYQNVNKEDEEFNMKESNLPGDINGLFNNLKTQSEQLQSNQSSNQSSNKQSTSQVQTKSIYTDEKKEQIIRYVKQELNNKVPPRKIYYTLIQHRHNPQAIKQIMNEILQPNQPQKEIESAPKKEFKLNMKSFKINFNVLKKIMLLLIPIIIIIALFFIMTQTECTQDLDCTADAKGYKGMCLKLNGKPSCEEVQIIDLKQSTQTIIGVGELIQIKIENKTETLFLDKIESNKAYFITYPDEEEIIISPTTTKTINMDEDEQLGLYIELRAFQDNRTLLLFDRATPNNIIILTIKESYNINEKFTGNIIIEPDTRFNAALIITQSFKDQETQYIVKGKSTSSTIKKHELGAIELINETISHTDSFKEVGNYEYDAKLYNCDELEIVCENATITDLKQHVPVSQEQKTIKVI